MPKKKTGRPKKRNKKPRSTSDRYNGKVARDKKIRGVAEIEPTAEPGADL